MKKRKNYTLVDLSFFESYLKELEIVCYYEPSVDEDSTKLRRRYYTALVMGLSTIEEILKANPPHIHQGEDIFKSKIVNEKEVERIRNICIEFLKLEQDIRKSIETMLTSRHQKFRKQAPEALKAFRKIQDLMPILLQAANQE